MTDKQMTFVWEYLTDCNATQAAIRAGYSEHTAYSIGQRLLRNVEVSNAINSAMSERQQRTAITQDYVLENLQEIAERCMQKSPVMVKGEQATDEEGRHLWTFDAKNAIRALELLGKHMAMFTDKVKADISLPEDENITLRIRQILLSMEDNRNILQQEQSLPSQTQH